MLIQDLIKKKRLKQALTDEEINFLINGVKNDTFNDYELSALLMAITINGMDERETTTLTLEMAKSGDILDLSKIDGVKADKHSTGGISDTTTIAIVPILASLGVKMAKMSGRSLGFTGGTIDKLEAIDGFNTEITNEQFIKSVQNIGASIISQTADIAVADKKLYALRDVTETVQSIPLIASSVMSKKIASGADIILLDVKFGQGAFMKDVKQATALANLMVKIGKNAGKKMCAIISSMEQPLGRGVGCTLEIRDAVEVLNGAKNRLSQVCVAICIEILKLAFNLTEKEAKNKVDEVISSKKALQKLIEIVKNQGGNANIITDLSLLKKSKSSKVVYANKQGRVVAINGEMLGNACKLLGGGRTNKGDKILHEVGFDLNVSLNDIVKDTTPLATIYYNNEDKLQEVETMLKNAFIISKTNKKVKTKLISKIIR
ncbi:MAG: thymidine phosphorylase [Clostridiales bacterium]|nr:thymidine phosphorylase [Clostridiales bacterium]